MASKTCLRTGIVHLIHTQVMANGIVHGSGGAYGICTCIDKRNIARVLWITGVEQVVVVGIQHLKVKPLRWRR